MVGGIIGKGLTLFDPTIEQLADVSAPTPNNGDVITYQAATGQWVAKAGGGSGTVTSVAASAKSGIIVSGSPITSSGTITYSLGNITPTNVSTGTVSASTVNSPTVITTTQSAADNSTNTATTAYVTTAITNAIAAVNPAIAVQAASAAKLPNSPIYVNGASGIGATITAGVTNTTLVVDGYTPALLERILVKNEADAGGLGAAKNGVYYVSQLAALGLAWVLTRALDYDQPSDMNNTGAIPVTNGTINATTSWVQTSQVTTVGTDAVTFAQFSYAPSTLITTSTSAGGDLNGIYPNPTISRISNGSTVTLSGAISAASLNVTGDILAVTGRVTASAATFNSKLTGATASFSGIVSADAGIRATIVTADSINITGDLKAATGRVTASAATISGILSATNVVTPIVSIAFNGTTNADCSQGSYFRGVAVSAFTLSAANAYDGQKVIFEILQDPTGSRVMTAGASFKFGTDISAAVLSTTASATDFVGGFYNKTRNLFFITAFVRGY